MPGIQPVATSLCRLALAGALLAVAAPAAAQAVAADQYQRVLAREENARAAATPALATLRAIAASYEAIVRRYPRSGYADNALWQAAGILELAHARFGHAADREKAQALLAWLRKEYPSSSLARRDLPAAAPADSAPTSAPSPPASATTTRADATSADATPAAGNAAVRSITHSSLPQGDRITIELTREVPYAADRLASPDRIFVDLANTSTASSVIERAATGVSGRLVKGTRVGVHPDGTSRVVLDVTGRPRYSSFPLYNPFRLVIDVESDTLAPASVAPPAPLVTADAARPAPAPVVTSAVVTRNLAPAARTPAPPPAAPPAAAASPAPPPTLAVSAAALPSPAPPATTSRGNYSIARPLGLRVSRVVIDPGHGGHDPGAQSNGLTEASLVLDIALRLEALLREEGVDVVLTRRTDTFVPLEERTAIANRVGSDVFVSIHANASPRSATAGVETYFLNFATNRQAETLAARENASSSKTMGALPTLLKAIALNNKLAESRELAGMIQTSLVKSLSTPRRQVTSLGVKQAPFVVLIGAQMPSILAEIGFITNRSEAALFKQPAGRQQVAQGLFTAILKYQATLKAEPPVARRTEGR